MPRTRVFLVVEGQVEGLHESPDVAYSFGPGDIVLGAGAFGVPALAWNARATSRARLLAFGGEDWLDLMEEHFDLVRSALAGLALERERLLDLLASNSIAASG